MINLKALLFAAFLLFALSNFSWAKNPEEPCADANMNLCEMVSCIRGEMTKYDNLLNRHYKLLTKSLPQEQATKLKKEQIQWVKDYAKLKKELEEGDTGTCSSVLQYLGEEVNYVKKRALELEQMTKQKF